MQVVWFKRDLRVDDHWPLVKAAAVGPCLCLYVYEPEIIHSEEFDASHLQFINQSLGELDRRLRDLGGRLTLRVGSLPNVLSALHSEHGIDALWSHEETGNKITYDRDLRVAAWVKQHGITWKETPQNGVVRRLKSRDGWSKQRDALLKQPLADAPTKLIHLSGVAPDAMMKDYELNVVCAVKCLQTSLPAMKAAGSSSVVMFSTVAVSQGMPMHASVAAAKGAVEGLTGSLAAELAPNIRVNCIAPSLTDTPLAERLLSSDQKRAAMAERHPLKRVGTVDDIASLAEFLLTDRAGWITGQVIGVDGGMSTVRL